MRRDLQHLVHLRLLHIGLQVHIASLTGVVRIAPGGVLRSDV